MFERYTEEARKSVFYARYEASQCGSKWIEPSHVLAGLLQADGALALRVLGSADKIDTIRESLLKPASKPGATVDLPFSQEGRRVLAYAAEESERTNQRRIGCEHVLVGLIRVSGTPAATILGQMGVTLDRVRQEAARAPVRSERTKQVPGLAQIVSHLRRGLDVGPVPDYGQDLSVAAIEERLDPVIGREAELQRVIGAMVRRHRNWVAITGEPGVGKTALISALAQQITLGAVPPKLSARRVIAVHAALVDGRRNYCEGGVILCVEGLFDLGGAGAVQAIGLLDAPARGHDAYIVATGSHEGFRRLPDALAGMFEEVELLPPTEAESLRILAGLKESFEKCHALVIADDALAAAVDLSRHFRSLRLLPDRAIDLLDDACAQAALRKQNQITRADIRQALDARLK